MKNSKKRFATPLIIFLVLILIASTMAYIYFIKNQTVSTQAQNNWNTYTNDKFSFSIQYPHNVTPRPSRDCESEDECFIWFLWIDQNGEESGQALNLLVSPTRRDTDTLQGYMLKGMGYTQNELTPVKINGIDGYKIKINDSRINHNQFYFFKNTDTIYQLSFSDSKNIPIDKERMLRSFTFIK